ncbi:unnamed protein product [Phytophthora fragariaefolia]|uniref:Unnamed protein product n=1 Tax=Phytophthora fragariaefolia TaxID=1490495 RepID=A0A9W6XF23_9STRA|nr:unnamed protein product [Phytophthora fragariaefolia]
MPEKLTTEELQEIESLRLPLSNDMKDPQATQIYPDRITGTVGATRRKRQLPVAVGAKHRSKQDIAATVISRTQRIRKTPVRYSDYKCYQTHIDNPIAVDAKVNRIGIPKSIRDALTGVHRKQWRQALDLEYQSLLENGTWKLTGLPSGHKALPCHWVLAIKYNADGTVERFKARLVAQGNHQEYGVNCDDVYARVARFESLRLVLAIGTILDCHIHQMDVSTEFLNGSMEGEHKVYMYQPPGYKLAGYESMVCELRKSIYGLKQAPKIWYRVIRPFFTSLGFVRCNKEYCIYVQNVGELDHCGCLCRRLDNNV